MEVEVEGVGAANLIATLATVSFVCIEATRDTEYQVGPENVWVAVVVIFPGTALCISILFL